eukprot:TRINITY_DN17492_c0_g1_i1.p1 TRINITY_DN17492_c0_g1~~TRINITY_DN17492_c0_g1_i1.p1  ORF type:complete len:233 (+),score=46.63 TRINITY_DN17492_c0_g1_i1:113-811(+)
MSEETHQAMASVKVEDCRVEAGRGINLCARIFRGDGENENRMELGIVVVHQYSLLGGCQALMKGIATSLVKRGYPTITFDMRGAGRSTGRASITGSSEVQDVIAICTWASQHLPAHRILLVGSSAGAPIAGSAVDQVPEVVGYVSLGYPFGMLASILFGRHHKAILKSPKPKLFVMGTSDGFTSVKQLENKLKIAAGRVETHLIPAVGHFQMEGPTYDEQMADLIDTFAKTL